jgi:DNA repair protein RecO
MAYYHTSALILHRYPVGETNQRYIAFSLEWGKIQFEALGTKMLNSKLAGQLEPIGEARLNLVNTKNSDRVVGVSLINSFKQLKNNFWSLVLANVAREITLKFLKLRLPDKNYFFLLKSFLIFLDRRFPSSLSQIQLHLFILSFLLKFLKEQGILSDFQRCSQCGKYFSSQENFNLSSPHLRSFHDYCLKTENSIKVRGNLSFVLKKIFDLTWPDFLKEKLNSEDYRTVKEIIDLIREEILDFPLLSLNLFKFS